MSWISASDPLALVAIQAGQIATPAKESAAAGANRLDVQQRSIEIGESVPIVFARRRNEAGGVLISPGASEARFENSTSNAVTAYYHLVLSEGRISSIAVKDVFQGACRVGTHSQTYDRRAGTWTPGNFIADRNTGYRRFFTTEIYVLNTQSKIDKYNAILTATLTDPAELANYPYDLISDWDEATLTNAAAPEKDSSWNYGTGSGRTLIKDIKPTNYKTPEASFYCGSVGNYPDMSTLSFSVTIPNGFDQWNRQVHCFIRGGMWVTRLVDNTEGPSDNFADLVKWMLLKGGRLRSSLIDTTRLQAAANFLETNRFLCNCNITQSTNYADFVAKWGPYFMVAESDVAGKRGLRPLLPVTGTGAIDTSTITPVFTFTEDYILGGSVEIQYTSLADRLPFVAQMIWRQQPDNDFGIIRTAEVRYEGTALDGPYESHDLSEFCCIEDHAVKAGAFILAKRRYTTHTIRFTARPQANNTIVIDGSIIRVRLARTTATGGIGYHDFLYQVERISKTLSGELSYEAVHFPIDGQGRSLVALDVASTTGTGIVLNNDRTGPSCDINSFTDNTVPAETFTPRGSSGSSVDIPVGTSAPPSGNTTNPSDGLDGNVPTLAPVFRDANGNVVLTPTANDRIAPYNPCGNGSEPLRAVYVNGQALSAPTASPSELQVVGTMTLQWNSSTQLQVYYYCRNANGQPVLTAKSQQITVQASPFGAPTLVRAAIQVTQMQPNRPDTGQTELLNGDQWMPYPPSYSTLMAYAFSWGGSNGRVATGYKPNGFRYSNGTTIYVDSALVSI